MDYMKEKGSNVMASSVSGAEKAKAVVDEKKDKMMGDQLDKEFATQRKEARIAEAEFRKQEAYAHNAQQKQAQANTNAQQKQAQANTNSGPGHTTVFH